MEALGAMQDCIETITEMTVTREIQVGVGLEKGHFLAMPITEDMIGAQVLVSLDPVQEQIPTEMGSCVINVGNTITT